MNLSLKTDMTRAVDKIPSTCLDILDIDTTQNIIDTKLGNPETPISESI
jgi:hypothetical protein